MATLTGKKSDFLSRVGSLSAQLLKIAVESDELTAFQTDNTFQAGGANAVADADCVGNNEHMTAAQVAAVMTVVAAFSTAMTPARRTILRQANRQPNGEPSR